MAREQASAKVMQCPLRIARRGYIVGFGGLSLGRVALALPARVSQAICASPVEQGDLVPSRRRTTRTRYLFVDVDEERRSADR